MRRLVLLFLTTLLSAQAEVEITAEPHHHQVLANEQVRVFSVDVAPHTDTLQHRHRHDYIYVMFGQSEIINAVEGKPPVTINLQDSQVGFSPGPFAHIVRNQDHPFRNVTIELLQDTQLHNSTHKWDETRGLDILHGGTKEILWVKDAIRATEFALQEKGTEAPISPAPYLLVAVSDLELFPWEHNAPMSLSMEIHLKPGEVQWVSAPHRSMLMNMGPAAKFVTLEFP